MNRSAASKPSDDPAIAAALEGTTPEERATMEAALAGERLPPDATARMKSAMEIRALLRIARSQGFEFFPVPGRRGVAVVLPKGSNSLSGPAIQLMDREGEVWDYLHSLKNLASAVVAESLPSPGEPIPEGAAINGADDHGTTGQPSRAPSIPPQEPSCHCMQPGCPVCFGPCGGGPPDVNGNTCRLPKGHERHRRRLSVLHRDIEEAPCDCPKGPCEFIHKRIVGPPYIKTPIFHGVDLASGPDKSVSMLWPPCPACDDIAPCDDHRVEQVPPPLPRWMLGVIGGLLAVLTAAVVYAIRKGGGM